MPTLQSANPELDRPPGRLYSFVVLALATIVVCISLAALFSSANTDGAPTTSLDTLTAPVARSSGAAELTEVAGDATLADGSVSVQTLSHRQLTYFLVAAIVVGVVGAIPSRGTKPAEKDVPVNAKSLATAAGLPLLGSVFAKSKPLPLIAKRKRINWLGGVVFLSEMILCVGVVVAIYGCFAGDGVSTVFVHNPFEAYAMSVAHLAGSFAAMFRTVTA